MLRYLMVGVVLVCGAGLLSANSESADLQLLKTAHLPTDPAALVDLLRARSLTEEERPVIQALIRDLGSEQYREREQAGQKLLQRGPAVIEMLRDALPAITDPEQRRRGELLIQRIQTRDHPPQAMAAAVRRLAARKPTGAAAALVAYLPYIHHEEILLAARAALPLLAERDGKVDASIKAALTDAHAIRRATAGEALVGVAAERAALIKLLDDPQPLVRWRVASALATAKEKVALPALIDVLPHLPVEQAWGAEDLLWRVAENLSPPDVVLGKDELGRKKCRDTWAAWWKTHEAKADLGKISESAPLLGNTIIVLLDMGQVLELSPTKQVRWMVDGLVFPLDVQFLPADKDTPEDRILVAEYHASRVTERTLKGEVVWQKRVGSPLAVQRLPDGNTFVATDTQLLEFDKQDKQVLSVSLTTSAEGERIMKAMKSPATGEMVCLTADARVVRLDKSGKETSSFPVQIGQKLFGGRVHLLSNGHVLVPHNAENKVSEYDMAGKEVWSVAIDQPVAATRLRNGNTLVTTMLPTRGAAEFDRQGNEVWGYKDSTRVTRALRR